MGGQNINASYFLGGSKYNMTQIVDGDGEVGLAEKYANISVNIE